MEGDVQSDHFPGAAVKYYSNAHGSLWLGDCLDILPRFVRVGLKADMILCDPPYGSTRCKWDTVIPFAPLWEVYKQLIKDDGATVLFGNEPFSSVLRMSNLPNYRYDWYWQKDKAANFLFGNKQPLKVIEIASVFYSAQPTYNPQKEINPKGTSKRHLSPNPSKITNNVRDVMGELWKETQLDETQNYHGKNYEPDKLLPKQLVYFAREQRGKLHPTQKPVALFEYLINTYTSPGEIVLDNCAGSGTTAVAAEATGRRWVLVEKEEQYCEVIAKRMDALCSSR
jgi:adenine specific DNA methylase Mod